MNIPNYCPKNAILIYEINNNFIGKSGNMHKIKNLRVLLFI